ncbi:MAG TPA: pitrilysin family protein [Blastocatellia bacterium]|nr:pitrilysin family protein [Blastocatellia bacterium]HMV81712.1 pitrilysin family protein [Blastocatellia bacterium]HMY74957.1 pitrilysin family protein [Blastocatellia bacterium]HMZ23236.1 pitrilysin family protein [Blastocatellia bacterium]HNG29670.1 pitrilysin family protein [Blastocatellia bacterium]
MMRVAKLVTTCLCCALLFGAAVVDAQAQGKGKNNPAAPEASPITPYSNVRRDNLLNGLQLVTLSRESDTAVKCDLIIRGGAMFDLAGKTGLASLTQASLMIVNPQVKEELASLGAKVDWGVTWDTTWFHIETPSNNFGAVFEIVARLLVVENIRPDAFKKAQQAELERLKANKLTVTEQADEAFLKAIYGAHPYGHNLEGDAKSLAAVTQGDVYDFFRKFYIANNASAVVTGNLSHDRVMQVFKVLFGGWVKGQTTPATFRQPQQTAQLRVVKVDLPEASNVELRGGLIGVKHTDADFLTTEIIARLLAVRLKREAESNSAVFSVKSEPRILAGPLSFSASISADKAQEFSRQVTEAFASFAATPVSGVELAAAKADVAAGYSAHSIEYNLRDIEMYLLPRNYPLELPKKIEAVTAADVQRVAKRLLDANALTVVVAGKVNVAPKSGL